MTLLELLISGGGLALVGVIITVLATRKRDSRSDLAQRFDESVALTELINRQVESIVETRVKAAVDAATKQMRDEIRSLKNSFRDAVRSWYDRLIEWDENDRPGRMPLPTKHESDILGIESEETKEQFNA
jgi:HAMP domain-containing protein